MDFYLFPEFVPEVKPCYLNGSVAIKTIYLMFKIAPVRKNRALSDDTYSGQGIEAGNLSRLMGDASGGIHWNEEHIGGDGIDGR